jgi:hypothetical protein
MNKTTTHELIIKKVYRETTKSESKNIKLLSILSPEVYNDLYEFSCVKKQIDSSLLKPSKATMANIYNYAKLKITYSNNTL